MGSEDIQPFKELEKFIKIEIDTKLNKFYSSFQNKEDGHRIKSINEKKHTIEFLKDSYKEGESEFETITFESNINHLLLQHIQISIKKLHIIFRDNFDDKPKLNRLGDYYIAYLNRTIFSSEILTKFNFLEKYRNCLTKEIHTYIPSSDISQTKNLTDKNIEQLSFESEDDSDEMSEEDIIFSIFNYMKDKNEKKEIILNEDDFNLLIKYTTHLIIQESLPEIEKQLTPNISNDLISFSYWVLHREIYTTKRIKPYFLSFLKSVFTNFKNTGDSSIKSVFGAKTRIKKDKFLPEIILKYL